ncbi:MAG TPA: pyruvate:ferredoxin (flavodoxin) oxidoreductase [bacterium]|nr:pyruvate:ferredoxin (flavodoxin) oxidoreductase [bacterium]
MPKKKVVMKCIDGNHAATHSSYALTEVAAIYPITPSSNMGENADEWSAYGLKNIFGEKVLVTELQSEGGASGAVHGSLSAGALTTTYTASQGLLLMIPNLYKMAGELLPGVLHVSARAVAAHALSIFGDHSDVMACRQTGVGLISSNSVQESMDLGLATHIAAIRSSLPFIHFFDGFRTSHEISKVEMIDYEDIKKIAPYEEIAAFKENAMRPDRPVLKGTAQNPDIFFQAKEASNPYYDRAPGIVQEAFDRVFSITGRKYHLFDYYGHAEAERVIIAMGSGCETIEETINYLLEKGEKVGLVKVRLYRPFSAEHFMRALPATTKSIAVLDRTKEPGSEGEPLYKDVSTLLYERKENIKVVGGRYGLSSKEFTPGMVKAIYDNLKAREPKNFFTVGINDDVTFTSLGYEPLDTVVKGTVQCKLYGLGSDGTVGASKNAIKIIGEETDMYAQGYFSYDSKKSGGITVSHLRFGKERIQSPYLITDADYVACHNQAYVYQYDLAKTLKKDGAFVLNTVWDEKETEENLPASLKKDIARKNGKVYIIDAVKIADRLGLGQRINMIMLTVFFKLAKVIPFEDAVKDLKKANEKSYGKKGKAVVDMNNAAIDAAAAELKEIKYDCEKWLHAEVKEIDIKKVHEQFVDEAEKIMVEGIINPIARLNGDDLPVSAFAYEERGALPGPDGSFPTATTRFEKRGVAIKLPKWIAENCIQCNKCSYVCPHAAIRPVLVTKEELEEAPETFKTIKAVGKELANLEYRMQVYPMDCQGCGNCADICPAPKGKALDMVFFNEIVEVEAKNNDFSINVPVRDDLMPKTTVKGSQFQQPLFEFSGACAGCGETPYVKLLTQLFGDRMFVSNATGCSSIYGGTAPTIPYCKNKDGYGPTWANSLFEDNAEYGYGMALAVRQKRGRIEMLMNEILDSKCDCSKNVSNELKALFKEWIANKNDADKTKEISPKLISALANEPVECKTLDQIFELSEYFVKKSVWVLGGDGWAYDIGYGGLDHVLASGENINVLVLDTEVYSNTGGQASKASQFGQIAKFAASGKKMRKKDLGMISMTYGYIYVASVAMGADHNQVLKAMLEAEAYDGPSIIIAYSPCINHGIDMTRSQNEMKLAVETGYWPLYRFNPALREEGKNPFQLDCKEPTKDPQEIINNEVRFKALDKQFPDEAVKLQALLKADLKQRWERLKKLSENTIL